MNLFRSVFCCLIAIVLFTISGCHHDKTVVKQEKKQDIITVKRQDVNHWLNYKGVLSPIDTSAITSPVDGRVKKVMFTYGSKVSKGQVVMLLNSQKSYESFVQSLQAYLQKKSAYYLQKENYAGSSMLYKRGVISRTQYLNTKSSFDSSQLGLQQAQADVTKLLSKVGVAFKSLTRITLQDQQAYVQKLKKKFENIPVVASADGVALFPLTTSSSSTDSSDDSTGQLDVGSAVKDGSLLLSVGDLSGYRVSFNVSEIEVTKIKPGMQVDVTGDGFPGVHLKGEIDQVASQSVPGNSDSALSMYKVTVKIPNVKASIGKNIYVGMSCFVKLKTVSKNALLIPISAIKLTKDNRSVVTVVGEKGNKTDVTIKTGVSTVSGNVTVLSGLKQGDKVVLQHD